MKNNEACAKKKRNSDLSTGTKLDEGEIERVGKYIISSLIMGHTKPEGKCDCKEQSSSTWSDYYVTQFSVLSSNRAKCGHIMFLGACRILQQFDH